MNPKQIRHKYGCYHSTHEVYGVLKEELDEFFDLVKLPTLEAQKEYPFDAVNSKKEKLIRELKDIANSCQKAIEELETNQIKFI